MSTIKLGRIMLFTVLIGGIVITAIKYEIPISGAVAVVLAVLLFASGKEDK